LFQALSRGGRCFWFVGSALCAPNEVTHDTQASMLAPLALAGTGSTVVAHLQPQSNLAPGDPPMSVKYSAIKWNANKRKYDFVILSGVVLYLLTFLLVGKLRWTGSDAISTSVLLMRGLGTCALVMLHLVLAIGPLARLDRRFLPVLYNRRHLGVATFLVGLGHTVVAIGYYHGFGRFNPLLSLLTSNLNYGTLTAFPFEILGLAALLILFLMAASSHDFWQKNLGPSAWKALHMLVYPCYALLTLHVALGALQSEISVVYPAILGTGLVIVSTLHLVAALRERRRDRRITLQTWLDVGSVDEIPESRAKTVCLTGQERIAVFRHDGTIAAVTNVCAHQRGPLGEGKIVDGCITCPWHGWEYRPEDGCSPPPFQEKIATYPVRVEGRRILLNPIPLPLGTPTPPAKFEEDSQHV
jgi:nitrite reductase/ring-hydroxylating ferredoxin subunit/DMSO/TMAO reductase YedYZ heme-binding membrane subunit